MKKISYIKELWWLVAFSLYMLFLLLISFQKTSQPFCEKNRDWKEILAEDTLRVIFLHHPSDAFVYLGTPKGFCYQLVAEFAQANHLFLKSTFVEDDLTGLRLLALENWDLLALPYPVQALPFPNTVYTETLFEDDFLVWCPTTPSLKKNKPGNFVCCISPYTWKGIKTLFNPQLNHCICQFSISPHTLKKSAFCKDRLLSYIIFAPRKWFHFLTGYKMLKFKNDPGKKIPFAWVTRKNSPIFNQKLNNWLGSKKRNKMVEMLFSTYYDNHVQAYTYNSFYSTFLSPYDKYIKKHATKLDWDWQLLASLIYEESHFLDTVTSGSGAYGIMQLMPFLMEKYGLDSSSHVEAHIKAGTLHLLELKHIFENDPIISQDLNKIIVASYNLGFYPIKLAIEKLYQQKKHPLLYADIMRFLKEKNSGIMISTVAVYQAEQFVHHIFERYYIYKALYP
jgi:membrane-bound lytic murein transglycosylase F